jgi:hypothetical protein
MAADHATNLTVALNQFRWRSGEEDITRYDLSTAQSFSKCFVGIAAVRLLA